MGKTVPSKAGTGLPPGNKIQGPDEDPEGWNFLVVENTIIPSKCFLPDFERERDVDAPKQKGSDRNRLVDNGLKAGSEVTIQILTTSSEQLRNLQDVYVKYMSPDRPLTKQNVVTVGHPALLMRGVRQLYFYSGAGPKNQGEGKTPLMHVFKAKVYDNKTTIGAGGSTKPKPGQTGPSGPTSSTLYGSTSQAAKPGVFGAGLLAGQIGNIGFSMANVTPPDFTPADPPVLMTPFQSQQLQSSTGNQSAGFANNVLSSRTPTR